MLVDGRANAADESLARSVMARSPPVLPIIRVTLLYSLPFYVLVLLASASYVDEALACQVATLRVGPARAWGISGQHQFAKETQKLYQPCARRDMVTWVIRTQNVLLAVRLGYTGFRLCDSAGAKLGCVSTLHVLARC